MRRSLSASFLPVAIMAAVAILLIGGSSPAEAAKKWSVTSSAHVDFPRRGFDQSGCVSKPVKLPRGRYRGVAATIGGGGKARTKVSRPELLVLPGGRYKLEACLYGSRQVFTNELLVVVIVRDRRGDSVDAFNAEFSTRSGAGRFWYGTTLTRLRGQCGPVGCGIG